MTESVPERPARVRAVQDGYALLDLHRRDWAESRYFRFFTAAADVDREVRRTTRAPDTDHAVVVAENGGLIVGAASYERLDAGEAELALLVDDRWQSRGVGTLLVERLAAFARATG